MKYLKQFGIILTVSFVGEILHHLIPLTIPASVYGIILMFILLITGVVKLESVKETADFLVKIMPVMFIPSAVGLIDMWDVISTNIVAYVIVIVATTLIVMVVSGVISQKMIEKSDKSKTDMEAAE